MLRSRVCFPARCVIRCWPPSPAELPLPLDQLTSLSDCPPGQLHICLCYLLTTQSDNFLVLVSSDIRAGQLGTWLNGRWDESVRDYAREDSLILGIQPDYTIGNGGRYVQGVIINDIQSFPYILFCRDKIYLHRNYINAINHQS
jgi:hypothetical protein